MTQVTGISLMLKCKYGAVGLAAALCLSACATHETKTVRVEPLPTVTPASVVLVDPSIDDAMLPAIGEGLSKGQVTIYSLDGPQMGTGVQPMPALTPVPEPVEVAPLDPAALALTPMPGQKPKNKGNADVSVFPLNDPNPSVAVLPPLPPVRSVAMSELPSPFETKGKVAPKPAKPKRPARGMTY
jgi:hypothetical protein